MSLSNGKTIILESVDSTNNYAMALIKNGEVSGGNSIIAMEQTHGKGSRGKEWIAEPGANIFLSIIEEMQWQPISQQFELIVAAALGVYDFTTSYIGENVKIKWPNDLFINDRKAGGILIENSIQGTLWQRAVIGIGININQTNLEQIEKPATSFKQTTGKNYPVLEMASELIASVLVRIRQLQSGNIDNMLKEYNTHLLAKDRKVLMKKEGNVFETTIKEVSLAGQLITFGDHEKRYDFGEVEWVGFVD